jgi:hypothetical protein
VLVGATARPHRSARAGGICLPTSARLENRAALRTWTWRRDCVALTGCQRAGRLRWPAVVPRVCTRTRKGCFFCGQGLMRALWPRAGPKLATVGGRSWGQWCSAGWVRVMGISVELRNDAVECLRLASQVKARRHKALLVDLARAWICIAEHVEQMRPPHSQRRGQTRRL